MKSKKKEVTQTKAAHQKKMVKGSNWEKMKGLILRNPSESKRRSLRENNPEKSVGKNNSLNLEALLNPDGSGSISNTPVIAIDCEMVGVGPQGESALARVSVVNFYGAILYDTFVKPPSAVTDYRTKYSGIRPEDLKGDKVVSLREAQNKVNELMKNRIVVGHSISNDLDVLFIHHPRGLIRDTALYGPLMYTNSVGKKKSQKLQVLVKNELGIDIQQGEHDSVDDARATMLLYKKHRLEWEASINKEVHDSKTKK